jgi:hypothetical protein
MVPWGLVTRQEGHWGLPGSGAAEQLGSQVFPSRSLGLYRVLCLEETGKMFLYPLTLALFNWSFPTHKDAFLVP